ncbi:MAG: beta-glucosidase, partial [Chloroflexi bacterium]|nr:beta-glucosidase [Chloroflexota bacterium]
MPMEVVGVTYYISPDGNNGNNGLTSATAWKSISHVNNQTLSRGTTLLFEGGEIFSGNLEISPTDCVNGTVGESIMVSSYGSGFATINAGNGNGFHAYNCDYIEVTNLVFTGSGSNNSGAGVFFYTDLPGNVKLDHIVIDHV